MAEGAVTIIGCGPGSAAYVTGAARAAAADADVLIGSPRLLDLFPRGPARRVESRGDVEAVLREIDAAPSARVVVLVSGDVGLSSLAGPLLRRLGRGRCRLVAGVSSVQVAFARLGLEWSGARIVSAHGRPAGEPEQVLAGCSSAAILCGTREAVEWAARAAASLSGTHAAFLCQDLTLPTERIDRLTAAELANAAEKASSLSIVVLAPCQQLTFTNEQP